MADPAWQLWCAFLAVLRAGSLSAAARQLRLTQPTIGRQIAALEAELGRTLFTRANDGLRPTGIALELAPHAQAMEAAASALLRAASAPADDLAGIVRLTASEFIGGVVLPPMLARFRNTHPAIWIELSLTDRTEDLLHREADLAVRNVAPTQTALVVRRIGQVSIGLFAHRCYAAAHGLPLSVAALADHPLIGSNQHIQQASQALGFTPRFAFRCDSDLGRLAAVRAGLGIGYCQAGVGRADPDLVAVLPGIGLAAVGIWLAMHEDLRQNRRVRALFDHLGDELTAYVVAAGAHR